MSRRRLGISSPKMQGGERSSCTPALKAGIKKAGEARRGEARRGEASYEAVLVVLTVHCSALPFFCLLKKLSMKTKKYCHNT